MNKFLHLVEEFDPTHSDPKWDLVDFLKSKGINVSLVHNTDMLYIDTGEKTIAVTISPNEEEAESINAGTGTYEVDQEVEKLAGTAAKGLKGMAARIYGTMPQQAAQAQKERAALDKEAIPAYRKGTDRIRKGLQRVKQAGIQPTY